MASPRSSLPSTRSPLDWALFGALSLMWASAYAFTRVAVEKGVPDVGLPANWVLAGRLTLGAVILLIVKTITGQRFPTIADKRAWMTIIAMGLVGSAIPFFFITTAQQTVNSSLAALYTSAAPIFVALGAHVFFHDERLTRMSIAGILIGFAGVAVLFGPDAMASGQTGTILAQIMLLCATLAYSCSTLIARGAPSIQPIAFAAGFISVSAIVSWPLALTTSAEGLEISARHWGGVIALGVIPTAIAQTLYLVLVKRAGATFLSLTGYSIPVASAIMGWVFFREEQTWNAVLAFVMILGGVWLARRSNAKKAG